MRLVKIGLASVNTTVGATHGNVERALRFAKEMAAADVTVAVYPEQMIGGYPPEDLIQWQGFVEDQWRALEHFARETKSQPTVHVLGVAILHEGLRYGCAAVVAGGEIRGLVPKEKLPTYSIYYEGRTFSRGFPYQLGEHRGIPFGDLIFRFDFGVMAPEVCEDAWTTDCPMRRRTYSGAELVVNISGSAFRVGTDQTRYPEGNNHESYSQDHENSNRCKTRQIHLVSFSRDLLVICFTIASHNIRRRKRG